MEVITMTKTNEIKTTATLINELNAIRTTAKATEINKKIAEINEQLKADSIASRDARINELLAMERNPLFVEFINSPLYTAFKLGIDKESEDYTIIERPRQIGFKQLDDAYAKLGKDTKTLANSMRYYGMISLFVHNLARNIAGDLSVENHKVTVPEFYGEKECEFDFSGCSMVALESQLNAIINAILPQEIAPKMLKADVKAIRLACVQDKMLKFTIQNEARIINKIFNAIEIRMNEKTYTLESRAHCHKAKAEKKSKKENKKAA